MMMFCADISPLDIACSILDIHHDAGHKYSGDEVLQAGCCGTPRLRRSSFCGRCIARVGIEAEREIGREF